MSAFNNLDLYAVKRIVDVFNKYKERYSSESHEYICTAFIDDLHEIIRMKELSEDNNKKAIRLLDELEGKDKSK